MRSIARNITVALLLSASGFFTVPDALAHLMVAQHGTLSVSERGVFMVLSLPVGAFEEVAMEFSGDATMIDFNNHRASIIELIRRKVRLHDGRNVVSLDDILLSPDTAHAPEPDQVSRVVVMGRFVSPATGSDLIFSVRLYGRKPAEKVLKITATSRIDGRSAEFELTDGNPASPLF